MDGVGIPGEICGAVGRRWPMSSCRLDSLFERNPLARAGEEVGDG